MSAKSFDKDDWLPVGMFLVAKLVSHTLLGFLLGAHGVLQAVDAPISWQRIQLSLFEQDTSKTSNSQFDTTGPNMSVDSIQRVKIDVVDRGYTPNRIKVKVNVPLGFYSEMQHRLF